MGTKKFPQTPREDDSPSIRRPSGGYTLVCHGDVRPTECTGWVTDSVSSFEEFTNLAEEHGASGHCPS